MPSSLRLRERLTRLTRDKAPYKDQPDSSVSDKTANLDSLAPYTYSALSKAGKIRLVTLRSGSFADNIQIDLCESAFAAAKPPVYEAISYTWGSQDDPLLVRVGKNSKLAVTRSLYSALQYLRFEDKSRTLWVDALAIDQLNSKEKSGQVMMMADIFRSAARVIAWLGPADHGTQRAMERLTYIGSQVVVDWRTFDMSPALGCKDATLSDRVTTLKMEHAHALAILALLSRNWFERLWIRQEIFLANADAIVQSSHHQMKWPLLRIAMLCLFVKSGSIEPFAVELYQKLGFLRSLIYSRQDIYITELKKKCANAKCKDPRDYIFAVSSMMQPNERRICPLPDYDIPVMEVYREVVLRYLSTFGALKLLRQCKLPDDASWPSWIPDWSVQTTTQGFRSPTMLASSKIKGWHDATEVNVLKVAGVVVDSVSDVLNIPVSFENTEELYDWIHLLLASRDLDEDYVTGGKLLEAYARALVCDELRDYVDTHYGTHLQTPSLEDAISATKYIHEHARYNPLMFCRGTPWAFFLGLACCSEGKKVIKSVKGYIGIAAPHTEVGDQICVLLGLSTSIILRAAGTNRYRVVGDSFVHGVSKGEALLGRLPANIKPFRTNQNKAASYAIAFLDSATNSVSFMDPRIAALPLDLEEYQGRLAKNGNYTIEVDPHILVQRGVDIKYFNLV